MRIESCFKWPDKEGRKEYKRLMRMEIKECSMCLCSMPQRMNKLEDYLKEKFNNYPPKSFNLNVQSANNQNTVRDSSSNAIMNSIKDA